MRIRTVLAEDEQQSMEWMERLITENAEDLDIVGRAVNGLEAVEQINILKPELLFLDVQMPGLNGFQVLERLPYMPFVVFVTAFDQYALDAFEENSLDYLLKPVGRKRFLKCLEKIRSVFRHKTPVQNQNSMQEFMLQQNRRLSVRTADGYRIVEPEEISAVIADDRYSQLCLVNGEQILSDYPLKILEEKFPELFLRIHRSTLVNINRVRGVKRGSDGMYSIRMKDGQNYDVSKRAMETVRQRLL